MAGAAVMGTVRNPVGSGVSSEMGLCFGMGMGGEEGCVLGRVENLSHMVLGFFEEGEESPESCCNDSGGDEDENTGTAAERKAFWESQNQLLQAALSRSISLEARIRRQAEDALRQFRSSGQVCTCSKGGVSGCRSCMLIDVSNRLRNAGYNCAVCTSKWRNSPGIPSGEHTYLDVIDMTNAKKGAVRAVIELNFRAEFEMARASQEYNSLVSRLPEIFVGKCEKLRNVIKVVCAAAKKCMKENKMHMGPWRKHNYMQAKWLSPCERVAQGPFPPTMVFSDHPQKTKDYSLLTFDLLENLPNLHLTAVKVL